MNDIWALPTGDWMVYSDDEEVIRDFLSLADLQMVTSYHGMFKKHRAMQFRFANEPELLHYVCFRAGFSYEKTEKLFKKPGSGYNLEYRTSVTQPTLLTEFSPRRKKETRRKSNQANK